MRCGDNRLGRRICWRWSDCNLNTPAVVCEDTDNGRRILVYLLEKELIEKHGVGKSTNYSIK
jgi:hypothetical protein